MREGQTKEIREDEKARDKADQQSVWALIDLEATQTQNEAAPQAEIKGEKAGIHVALSKPCYELWTLLHLHDTGEAFADCDAVISRLKRDWRTRFGQSFVKSQADYSKIIEFRIDAAKLAKQHHKNRDPSWTEVFGVIEEIEQRYAQ